MKQLKYKSKRAFYAHISRLRSEMQDLENGFKEWMDMETQKKQSAGPEEMDWEEFEEYVKEAKPTRNMIQERFGWNFDKYDQRMSQATKRYLFEWEQDAKGFSKISAIRKRPGVVRCGGG